MNDKTNETGVGMTPGPWVVWQCRDGVYAGMACIVATQSGFEIAGPRQLGYPSVPMGHAEANAKAIAALPDCIKALQDTLTEIRAYQGESEFEGGPVKDICDQIKSALNKAGVMTEDGEPKHGPGYCEKREHIGCGYLHAEGDDGPYDVDGWPYCGRCHRALKKAGLL